MICVSAFFQDLFLIYGIYGYFFKCMDAKMWLNKVRPDSQMVRWRESLCLSLIKFIS